MALEDLAMFRAVPGCTVFYPSDAVSMERAVELAANTKGMCFIRSSRPNLPVLYDNEEELVIGKAKVRPMLHIVLDRLTQINSACMHWFVENELCK